MGSVKQPMEKKGQVTKPQVPDKTSIDQGVGVVKGLMGRIVGKLWKNCDKKYGGEYMENCDKKVSAEYR